MKFLQISDTHLVARDEDLFFANPLGRLADCVDHINRNHADAEVCVITGDLAHWGEDDAYSHLKRVLDRLTVPLELVIGNHDIREKFTAAFPAQSLDENGFVQSVRQTPAGRFILLDTVQAGTHAGHFCEDRQDWLRDQLKAAGDEPCFLFMHHHPVPVHVASMDTIGLMDGPAFGEILKQYRDRIAHIFFGHCHLPLSGSCYGIPFSSVTSTNHPLLADFNNRKISIADTEPAYAVVFAEPESVVVHFEEFAFSGRKMREIGTSVEDWSPEPAAS